MTAITCEDSYSIAFPIANLYHGEGPWPTWTELY
jgi:hypothetical protein